MGCCDLAAFPAPAPWVYAGVEPHDLARPSRLAGTLRMRRLPLLPGLLLAALSSAVALAAAGLAAVHPWSRPAAQGGSAVGYVKLANSGPAEVLMGAESPAAQRVEMHVSSMAGGVMRMGAEAAVPVPAHGQVVFAPDGRHLMFVGLKRALKVGDRLPATLRFKSGRRLHVDFLVSAQAPGEGVAGMPGMR
jgi:copper(I)-binding protein